LSRFVQAELSRRGSKGRLIKEKILYSQGRVELKAPILNPSKIIALGLNYIDHCREQGLEPPDQPIIFAKYPSAIIGPEEPIVWPAALTQQVDYEAELALIIGKRAKGVPIERAFDYIAGYTLLNDVTARDLQFAEKQWTRAKSLDTFCPMGPALVSKEEVQDPHHLRIRCYLNEELMQDSTTENFIFDIPHLVSFLSHSFTLLPGDVIATGTPGGVGAFRQPPVFLKPGDRVRVEVEGIGSLSNPVRGPIR
ncbi:TPA: FAA hydrolase family protein, partial [Candidatus Poribacteria bacterium]|nr:FAA hydrolase family protein [Candidatus Poribacteria bacterium]